MKFVLPMVAVLVLVFASAAYSQEVLSPVQSEKQAPAPVQKAPTQAPVQKAALDCSSGACMVEETASSRTTFFGRRTTFRARTRVRGLARACFGCG